MMSDNQVISTDQIAFDGMCRIVGQLQGQVQLLQARLQFEQQEKAKLQEKLERYKAKVKPEKEGE